MKSASIYVSVIGLAQRLWSRLSALNIISESQIVSRIFFFRVSKLLTIIVVFGFRRHIVCRVDYEVATSTEQRRCQIEETPSPAQGFVSVAGKIYSIDCLWCCMVVHLPSSG